MKFKIIHKTEYSYSEDVFLEPHYFRFQPKVSKHTILEEYRMTVEPSPAGFSDQIDSENNAIRFNWFEGIHDKLSIEVNILVNVAEFNPFNFLVHPDKFSKIPFIYDERTNQILEPALAHNPLSEPLSVFLFDILETTNHQSVPFILELTKQIHQTLKLEIRETGEPHLASHTFEHGIGSCRDLAWMEIQLLRSLGMAARFVSGYFYVDSDNPSFELHAWVEVFLPGAGWIGFDPSHGIIVGSYHIPLASSSFHENTMPVTGTVRGKAIQTLKNELDIKLIL